MVAYVDVSGCDRRETEHASIPNTAVDGDTGGRYSYLQINKYLQISKFFGLTVQPSLRLLAGDYGISSSGYG